MTGPDKVPDGVDNDVLVASTGRSVQIREEACTLGGEMFEDGYRDG